MLKKIAMKADREFDRMETPRTVGFRAGMSSSGVIGHRLGNLYEVPGETPDRMDELLRALARRDGRRD